MKESLKNLFAMLAGVDPSDIEIYAGEEDEIADDDSNSPNLFRARRTCTERKVISSSRTYRSGIRGWRARRSSAGILIM